MRSATSPGLLVAWVRLPVALALERGVELEPRAARSLARPAAVLLRMMFSSDAIAIGRPLPTGCWCERRFKPFVKLARTIRQHKSGMLAAIELDINNVDGVVRVSDVPLDAAGRAYLVGRGLE